jgi:hypothetical protein
MKRETEVGLLYVRIKQLSKVPTCDKKFSNSKLIVKVGGQGYINLCDMSQGAVEFNEVRMYECSSDDSLEL